MPDANAAQAAPLANFPPVSLEEVPPIRDAATVLAAPSPMPSPASHFPSEPPKPAPIPALANPCPNRPPPITLVTPPKNPNTAPRSRTSPKFPHTDSVPDMLPNAAAVMPAISPERSACPKSAPATMASAEGRRRRPVHPWESAD